MKKRFLSLLVLITLVLPAARADRLCSFRPGEEPEDLGFLVCDYTGTVTLTFLGDCTLGGEPGTAGSSRGYAGMVRKNGVDWPMHGLLPLTGNDDLTVANLEGVLTDRDLPKVDKTFNFSGPTSLTGVLTAGSIECVTLANNHIGDYGAAGEADTKDALAQAGVSWFDTETVTVWEREGLMIGFTGVAFNLNGQAGRRYQEQVRALRDMGCAAIITVMHAGVEYDLQPSAKQQNIASVATGSGVDLVVGHHPHVVQGYELVNGKPVVYSLGNCSFGGNGNPSDYDALVLQAELSFESGSLTHTRLHFYPISVSGMKGRNDFAPVLLDAENAQRVLDRMLLSTGKSPGDWSDSLGAVVDVP